jgi:hypothetical protein
VQTSDSVEQLAAVATQVLQVLRRQVAKNCVIDLVLVERRFILTEANVSEPCPNINGRALAGHGVMIVQAGQSV